MNEPAKPKNEDAERVITFKRHAHLFTLISVMWTAFTVVGISLFQPGHDHQTENLVVVGIWVLHAIFIGLSIYFWKTERESVLMIEVDVDKDMI